MPDPLEFEARVGRLGKRGLPGAQVILLDAAPGAGDGNNGDWAIVAGPGGDTTLHGPKSAGAWPTPGRSIRGTAGPPGPRPGHVWDGTALRIELPEGGYGDPVDLRGLPGVGDVGPRGYRGWHPVVVPVEVEVESEPRIVYRLIDWIGGQGPKPASFVGDYARADGEGWTGDPAEALDVSQYRVDSDWLAQTDPWLFRAIGEPVALWDDMDGVDPPPTDRTYRYVLLTAGEDGAGGYNEGILTGESVSGSAPDIAATAQLDLPASPLHGETIRLINTERRIVKAGGAGTVESDAIRNITGSFGTYWGHSLSAGGAFDQSSGGNQRPDPGSSGGTRNLTFDASREVPTAAENRPRNVGVTYYMRVL